MAIFTPTFLALAFLVAVSNAAPNREINLKLPEECKGKGFCSIKPEGYDEMLDLLDSFLTPAFLESIQKIMEDRDGGLEFSPDEDNCPYRNETEWPFFYSHSGDSDFDVILQNTKLLQQPVQSITCAFDKMPPISTTGQCFRNLGLSPLNMVTRCETLTANRTFIVFSKNMTAPVAKSYPVNCCCTCNIYESD